MPAKAHERVTKVDIQASSLGHTEPDKTGNSAAIRAKYSAKTAEQQGYQLLQKTSVQKAIAEALEEQMKNEAKREGTAENPIVLYAKDGDIAEQIEEYVDTHEGDGEPLHFLCYEDDDEVEAKAG